MKKTNEITLTGEEALIAEARNHAEQAAAALRKGCEHALLAGMRLVALHQETAQDPVANLRRGPGVSRETSGISFEDAVTKIGIKRPTAYRWMSAVAQAAMRAGLLKEDEDFFGEFPAAGSVRWEIWEGAMVEVSRGMSLNRLLLGAQQGKTDVARHNDLLTAEEEGRARAIELMEAVEEGRYTLAQAVKALGSQEAYDKLRAEGGEKVRRDPVYLEFDFVSQLPVGLVPRAFTTLKNAFEKWDEYDDKAREKAREIWLDLLKAAPVELTSVLRAAGGRDSR